MSWKFGKKISDAFGLAIDALEVISRLTSNVTDDKAVPALRAVAKVVETLKAGFEGKIGLEACEHALAEMRAQFTDNDERADAALRDRFPTDPVD